uniref:RNA polymerase alpha subunit n=1 Tax=Coelastrum microporum TaxID=55409 RepID=UPI00226CBF59|nr:RNA polymerase alpha subunit [Coelastrum microporum]UWM13102.1 RNA polymerase alpha subunit [Coelastrum microporum]
MIKHPQDFFLNCKECVLENPRHFYGCFSIGPFQNSQSLTVANALRRTLLSELHGIAITHIEINGVLHEYSTLPGLRESVLDILLNFKQIVLKKVSQFSKPLYGYLNVRGPGIIRASDLKLPPLVQCVDPDQYIATLNENGKLLLKFQIADFHTSMKNQEILANEVGQNHKFSFENNNSSNGYRSDFVVSENGKFHETFDHSQSPSTNFSKGKSEFRNRELSSKMPKLWNFQNNENGKNGKSSDVFAHFRTSAYNKRKTENGKIFENGSFSKSFSFQEKNDSQLKMDMNPNSKRNNVLSTSFKKDFVPNLPNSLSLWVDPLFNPILKVNYVIENLEPFRKNKPNQVVLIELWTNGSIHPRTAFYDALFYLKSMFEKLDAMKFVNSQLTNSLLSSEKTNTKFLESFEKNITLYTFLEKKNSLLAFENKQKQMLESFPIEHLQLPSRIQKTLHINNLQTIGDLVRINPQDLKKFPGIGTFSFVKIQKSLEQIGFEFKK